MQKIIDYSFKSMNKEMLNLIIFLKISCFKIGILNANLVNLAFLEDLKHVINI